jgi:signal transduction histidine kinase/CheY-like chemotaxis protein/HPt (histidine-containing phosphotransfer) domain-containing protein
MKLSIKRIIHEDYKQVIFVFLAFLAMVLISYFFAGGMVERYMAANAERMLATAEARIQAKFDAAKLLTLSVAFPVRDRLERGQSLDEIERYLRDLTRWLHASQGNMDFISVYGIFNGQFLDGQEWTPPDEYRPDERPWAIAARAAAGDVAYTTPFVNIRDGRYVVAVSTILRGENGQNYGVIAYNMVFKDIADYFAGLQFAEDGYGMLMGPDFRFLIHPDDYCIGRDMAELSEAHAALVEKMRTGTSRSSMVKLVNHQGVRVAAFYQRMANGWYIGMADPMKNYHRDLAVMAFVLSVVGAVLMAGLSYTLIKLTMEKIHSDDENKSKTSFLARMSHEIRTPMNSILGISEIVLRKNISGEISEYISIIRQSGNTLLSIINDILDFSKIESGHVQIEAKEYSFASLINDVINVIQVRLVEKPLDFFVTLDGAIPAVLVGDEARIRQILINLLNNAVKYTREGHISCAVEMQRLEDHRVELAFRISDTGIGIRETDISRLFNDFTRVDLDHNQGIEGTGLGLAIANSLCAAMGGGITVSSEYGKGSIFTARVTQLCVDDRRSAFVENAGQLRTLAWEERPLHAAALRSALENIGVAAVYADSLSAFIRGLEEGEYDFAFVPSRHAADCIPAWSKRGGSTQLIVMAELGEIAVRRDTGCIILPVYSIAMANVLNGDNARTYAAPERSAPFVAPRAKVLIVDDIPTNLRVAAELMAPYRMQIDSCQSGAEAVAMAQSRRYDLIFMDHMMPGMDGIKATALIRAIDDADGYYQTLPVIMLTANAVSGQREMFLQNGANDFLAKPIEVQKLNAILEKWLPESKREETADDVPGNGGPGDAPDVLELPGVFVSQGLANVGGSLPVYLDIIALFARDALERIRPISDAAAAEDFNLYTTMVHALKSSAYAIGARDLGDRAADLEEAGRTRNAAVIAEKTGPFLEGLKTLAADISDLADRVSVKPETGGAAEPGDISALRLEVLKEALLNMDIETINQFMLDYSSLSLDAEAKELANRIEEDILLFEYGRAVERIDRLSR